MENQITNKDVVLELAKAHSESKELFECALTYLQANNTQLTPQELKQFLMLCHLHKMNPLKREVYAIKYGNKFDIITNYNEYLKKADQTGLVEYYKVEVVENPENPNYPLKAIFRGKRKDQTQELITECRFIEYTTGQSTWKTKPFFMLEKCAYAKGIRLLFPNELGSMPYVNEELWYQSQENQKAIEDNIKIIESKNNSNNEQNENEETSPMINIRTNEILG